MTLSTSEIQSLRRHLGFGNISTGAYPYTPDGFVELFTNVIAPNLQTAAATSATTTITAGSVVTVTPLAMTEIVANARLVIDVAEDAEIVVVKAITGTTFTARFAFAHAASGYPVAVESGESTLRMLLHSADKAWQTLQSASITKSAGLKQLGKGEIEWFGNGQVFKETRAHYLGIVAQIGQLVRVEPIWPTGCATATTEPY